MLRDKLTQSAINATLHCLTGCAIGEILGMIIGTAASWNNLTTAGVSTVLAFVFGYGLTSIPLLRNGMTLMAVVPLAFASDSLSIGTMEIVDNTIIAAIPGAMNATLVQPLFWLSLGLSLMLAFAAAVPVNRFLLSRGKGHAHTHQHHTH